MIIGKTHHSLFQANTQNFILKLHRKPFKAIDFNRTHFLEQFIESLVRILLILFNPGNEAVLPIQVFKNTGAFQDGVESLLCIRLNNVLLMLHQTYNLLKGGEIVENLTH